MTTPIPYDVPPTTGFGPVPAMSTSSDSPLVPPDGAPSASSPVGAGGPSVGWLQRARDDSVYLLTGFPLKLLAFVVVLVFLALGAGLLVLFVGLYVLVAGAFVARAFAAAERRSMSRLLHVAAPEPLYQPRGRPGLRGSLAPLSDPQSWLDIMHAIVSFPISGVTWSLTVSWWLLAIGGVTRPLWYSFMNWVGVPNSGDLTELMGMSTWQGNVFYVGIGLIAAATLPPLLRGMAALQGGLSQIMLCSRAEMQQRVATVEQSRASSRVAQSGALRRLERDIHDGPQQRLVRLQMDLARAKRKLDADPDGARRLLDEASAQTRDTLDELRNLSRGLAPPLLVDRGLAAALGELSVRSTVPTELTLDVPQPLGDHLDAAVYFVASEALTNVAKHSGAQAAIINVVSDGRTVTVTVADDGVGGAALSKGRGLAGLADRVAAVEGTLTVDSPTGGPTVVRAVMPCG